MCETALLAETHAQSQQAYRQVAALVTSATQGDIAIQFRSRCKLLHSSRYEVVEFEFDELFVDGVFYVAAAESTLQQAK